MLGVYVRRLGSRQDYEMTVHLPSQIVQVDGSVSVQEAASTLGCSEKTVRRRIKAGTLSAYQLPTSQGYEWRVHVNGATDQSPSLSADQLASQSDQLPGESVHVDDLPDTSSARLSPHSNAAGNEPLLKALGLVERLQRENMELAGRVGFLQAKLQTAEEQLLALTSGPAVPTVDEPEAIMAPATASSWLERLLSRLRV